MDLDQADAALAGQPATRVPAHAHVVVVPVANPRTAPELLTLARAIARADGGRVIALVVVKGDAEADHDRVEALEAVVADLQDPEDGVDLELLTRPATSVSRGIVDVAVDEGADMIVLGVQIPTPGEVDLGPIAEGVLDAAHCDVLIYRRSRRGTDLSDVAAVTSPVDGSPAARVGARVALILAHGIGCPVRALHVRRPGVTVEQARVVVDQTLAGLPDADDVERVVVNAGSAAAGLRAAVEPTELAVVGFDNLVHLDGRHMGRTPAAALDTLPGPVIVVSRPHGGHAVRALTRRVAARLRPRMTEAEARSLLWHARLQGTLTADFVVLSILSAMIASFGLLLGSPAVVIGAMLIAPLMDPLIASATALVEGHPPTLRRAGTTVLTGAALVAGTAAAIGLIAGADVPTAEMASRGSPTLVDAGVAVASGMAGAYASARRGIPAALAGTAIAAALVPPVCVFGLALASHPRLAVGAGLLFAVNILFMVLAGAVMLRWLGLRGGRDADRRTRLLTTAARALLLAGLVVLVAVVLPAASTDLQGVADDVGRALPDVEVVEVDARGAPGTVTVTVRAATPPPAERLDAVARQVARDHGVQLRVAVQQLVEGG